MIRILGIVALVAALSFGYAHATPEITLVDGDITSGWTADPGFSCEDNGYALDVNYTITHGVLGDIGLEVLRANSHPGEYTITYGCVSFGGTHAPEKTRTVNIGSTVEIYFDGPSTVAHTTNAAYTDPVFTCTSSDGSSNSTTSNAGTAVTVGTDGAYTVTYDCEVNGVDAAPLTRTIVVTPDTIPLARAVPFSRTVAAVGGQHDDSIVACIDLHDRDTYGTRPQTTTPFTNTIEQTLPVSYFCRASSGQTTSATLTIDITNSFSDTNPPDTYSARTFTGSQFQDFPSIRNCEDDESGRFLPTITSTFDGVSTAPHSLPDLTKIGAHVVTFTCIDAAGNSVQDVESFSTGARTAQADRTSPTIYVEGDRFAKVNRGAPYVDAGATCYDNIDGVYFADPVGVEVVNGTAQIDTSKAGRHLVGYVCFDSAGNVPNPAQGRESMAVRVVDVIEPASNTAPTAARVGAASVSLAVGESYTDAGFTCTDPEEGEITDPARKTMSIDKPFNNMVADTYTVTLKCEDVQGQSAQVMRSIEVTNADLPVISFNDPDTDVKALIYSPGTLVDPGATCVDKDGGDLPIPTATLPDVTVAGPAEIKYRCDDAANGVHKNSTRTIQVVGDDGLWVHLAAPARSTTTCNIAGSARLAGELVDGNLSVTGRFAVPDAGTAGDLSFPNISPALMGSVAIQSHLTGKTLTVYNYTFDNFLLELSDSNYLGGGDVSFVVPADVLAFLSTDPEADTYRIYGYYAERFISGNQHNFREHPNLGYDDYLTFSSYVELSYLRNNGDPQIARFDQNAADFAPTPAGKSLSGTTPPTITNLAGGTGANQCARGSHFLDLLPSPSPTLGGTLMDGQTFSVFQHGEYTEPGASCTDETASDRPARITVNNVVGGTVDVTMDGDYVVKYDCPDGGGSEAQILANSQTVTVTVLPLAILPLVFDTGASRITEEASNVLPDSIINTTLNSDGSIDVEIDHESLPDNELIAFYQIRGDVAEVTGAVYNYDLDRDTGVATFTVPASNVTRITNNPTDEFYIDAVKQTIVATVGGADSTIKYIDLPDIRPEHYRMYQSFVGITALNTDDMKNATEPGMTDLLPGYTFGATATQIVVTGQGSHTIPPTIELLGANPHTESHDTSDPYVDPGAWCIDSTGIRNKIPLTNTNIDSTVVRSTVGMYYFNYTGASCVDSGNGKSALEDAFRSVDIRDTAAPVLTYNDPSDGTFDSATNTLTLEAGVPYTDPEARCADDAEPNLPDATGMIEIDETGVFVTTPAFDPADPQEGDYTLTYNCADNADPTPNNAIALVITVNVRDTIDPKIQLVNRSTLPTEVDAGTGIITHIQNETFVNPVAVCNDSNFGPDFAPAVITRPDPIELTTLGTTQFTITCSDLALVPNVNATVYVIEVEKDIIPPVIAIGRDTIMTDVGEDEITFTVGEKITPIAAVPPKFLDPDFDASCTDNLPIPLTSANLQIPTPNSVNFTEPKSNTKYITRTFAHHALSSNEVTGLFEKSTINSFTDLVESNRHGLVNYVGDFTVTYYCQDNFGNNDTETINLESPLPEGKPTIIPYDYLRAEGNRFVDHGVAESMGNDKYLVTLELGELYREGGAICIYPEGTFEMPAHGDATVGGQRVQSTVIGEYLVEYTCTNPNPGGTEADKVTMTVRVVEEGELPAEEAAPQGSTPQPAAPDADLRPDIFLNGDPLIGTEKITHSVGSTFRDEVTCRDHGDTTDIIPLIVAAQFIETNPLEKPTGDKPVAGVSNNDTTKAISFDILKRTIDTGFPLDPVFITDVEDGMEAAEFIKQAPPGRYEVQLDCEDTTAGAAGHVRRAALLITIIAQGGSDDWILDPTFGRSWDSGTQVVTDGFSFNGRVFTVVDNYHVDFERTTSVIGQTNTVTMKVFTQTTLDTMILAVGVPELSRLSDAEAEIQVKLLPDYSLEEEYVVTDIIHVQDEPLLDTESTSVSLQKTECNDETEAQCYEFTVQFVIMAPLKSDVLAISAIDSERRVTVTYINDGVEFAGESLLPAETATLHFKRGNQHPVETIHLTQEDRRYNAWSDQHGYAWLQNEYGSWFQLTQAGFEKLKDPSVTVMTRTHSDFKDLIQQEREKARAIFDAADIESHVGESFSHDAPVRIDKLSDPEVLEKLKIAELRAIEYLKGK